MLSPQLFNLYLHDLPNIFDDECDPVQLSDCKISCLMYADDLVLLSESHTGLQTSINRLKLYCEKWKLKVNLNKTKILIFNKGGHKFARFSFTYDNLQLEIVQNYCYLGIDFTAAGTLTAALNKLKEKAHKALFKFREHAFNNNIRLALKLFKTLIIPILTYASEAWGPFLIHNMNDSNFMTPGEKTPIENVNIRFCRYVLGVHRKSCNAAVRGELGQYPILLIGLCHSLKYWSSLHVCDPNSLISLCLKENYNLLRTDNQCWVKCIKTLLSNCGLHNIWNNLGGINIHKSVFTLRKKMESLYNTAWFKLINGEGKVSNKLKTYCQFKHNFNLSEYLTIGIPVKKRRLLTKLRISAHSLHIETGRYNKIQAENRLCNFCSDSVIEDEYHFMLACSRYTNIRNKLLSTLRAHDPTFNQLDDRDTFIYLMTCNTGDCLVTNAVTNYIDQAFSLGDAT